MALPKPNCSFVIPSVHDDLELNCRIYYPRRTEQNTELFGRSFAIFAHPYAPLGGCYDDPVVGFAGSVLLRGGCVLVTFNFRGAAGSAGRTTWSGKAELADYVSVYGFVLCYIDAIFRDVSAPVSDGDRDSIAAGQPPVLILGGYSYGSMIAAHLPSPETVAGVFKEPKPDSAESEIQLRAKDLAKDMKAYFAMHAAPGTSFTVPKTPSQMGGYESDAASRRVHRESSRRSIDGERVRKSVDKVRKKLSRDTRIQCPSSEMVVESTSPTTESSPVVPLLAYVLVSPLLSTVAGFTTMFSKLKFIPKGGGGSVSPTEDFHELVSHPCCCLYGTEDMFTSERKLRRWTEELAARSGPKFVVVTAQTGHFWREADGVLRLRQGLAEWVHTLPSQLKQNHSQNAEKFAA